MNSSERCQWEAVFGFCPPIGEKSIAKIEGIKFEIEFDTEKVGEGIILKGFSIITPTLAKQEASLFVWEKANRIFDYLSAIHNYSIEGYLSKMVEVQPEGEVKTGYVESTVGLTIRESEALDFNKDSIKRVLQNNDEKLVRQLSHFRRGLETDDVITEIREFYLICEDEYPPEHPFIKKYKYARNLQSHAKMDRKNSIKKAKDQLEKNYMDPSDPKAMEAIKRDSKIIEKEAREIINRNI